MIDGPDTSLVVAAVGAIVLTALLVGVLVGAVKSDRRAGGALFRSMSKALDLSWRQRRLIWSIAVRSGVRTPASLLVSRGCFEHARRRCPLDESRERRLEAIVGRVFDEPG